MSEKHNHQNNQEKPKTMLPDLTAEQKRLIALSELELMNLLSEEGDDQIKVVNGEFVRDVVDDIHLIGEEACKFLNIPVRQALLLKKGDHERIFKKFDRLINDIQSKPNAQGINVNDIFWNNIRFKVVSKANLGKQTNKNDDGVYLKYAFDMFRGENLLCFIPDCKNEQVSKEYFVQMVDMVIPPTLQQALQVHGFTIPKKGDK